MKILLLSVIILSVAGCALMPPAATSSTGQTKRDITTKWSKIEEDLTKSDVELLLGIPTDIHFSEDAEIWKYIYDIARTYGTVSFRSSDERVWFYSKPSF